MRGRQGGVTTEACLSSGTSKQDDYAAHSSLERFTLILHRDIIQCDDYVRRDEHDHKVCAWL